MAELTARIRSLAGALLFNPATVTSVVTLGERFVRLRVRSPAGVRVWAGDKVQVLLGKGLRTYTPFDADPDGFSLVVYVHGDASPRGAPGR